ncbi:MAG TPA: hypothetical protein V6C57_06350 [Coleofasciculaceae cyanobacterium]
MVVKRKPKPTSVEEFIEAGGSAPTAEQQPTPPIAPSGEEETKSVKLRLTTTLLKQIDDAVAKRRPSPSRHQWILEAIWEKLERDEAAD